MAALQYNSTGRPVVRIGNWAEEAALMDSLSLECNSQTRNLSLTSKVDTNGRVFPLSSYNPEEHFLTTNKATYRREVHLEHGAVDADGHPARLPSTLPRRQAMIQSAAVEEAKRIHTRNMELLAQHDLEVEKRKRDEARSKGRTDELVDPNNPFAHRIPMNRSRAIDFGRPNPPPTALYEPAITVYSRPPQPIASLKTSSNSQTALSIPQAPYQSRFK